MFGVKPSKERQLALNLGEKKLLLWGRKLRRAITPSIAFKLATVATAAAALSTAFYLMQRQVDARIAKLEAATQSHHRMHSRYDKARLTYETAEQERARQYTPMLQQAKEAHQNFIDARLRQEAWRLQSAATSRNLSQGLYDEKLSCRLMGEMDPLCGTVRPLTADEKRLLSDFFGPRLPVDDIRIRYVDNVYSRGFIISTAPNVIHINTRKRARQTEFYSSRELLNITGENPDLADVLFHESTHILQALKALPDSGIAEVEDPSRYVYHVEASDDFADFTNEQGASIVGDYVRLMFQPEATVDRCQYYGRPDFYREGECQGEVDGFAARMVMAQFQGAASMASPLLRNLAASQLAVSVAYTASVPAR